MNIDTHLSDEDIKWHSDQLEKIAKRDLQGELTEELRRNYEKLVDDEIRFKRISKHTDVCKECLDKCRKSMDKVIKKILEGELNEYGSKKE